jgi:GxxExxY protein
MIATESFHTEVTSKIIEAAIEVHRILGPGFLESVYEEALAHEMDLRGISYEREKEHSCLL